MDLQELAHELATLPINHIELVANLAFDEIEATKSAAEVESFRLALLEAGIDVRPLCKKKHPA